MRRLLRDIAEQRELGDVTTLLDPTVTEAIRGRMTDASAEAKEG
jgi:acetyl-CoA synthetase